MSSVPSDANCTVLSMLGFFFSYVFYFIFFGFVCKLFVKKTRNQKKNGMLTKEATSSTVVATYQQWFLFVTLRLPFRISANVWLNTILDKCRLWEESMYFIL